jgi:beta-ribofuranosylaminobenzene 5'-phosphate synthase
VTRTPRSSSATFGDRDRAFESAARFLAYHDIVRGARVRVHRALPSHAGLGSGTQLALAVARALAELHDLPATAPGLARAVGRARRSAIGMWIFADGGLVVEGGRRRDRDQCGPLLARLPFPASWRCVVAVPHARPGKSGAAEEEAFAQLLPPPAPEVERVSHIVLMALLPALVEADLPTFGAALTEIQEINGRWFAPVQGGMFAPGPSQELVRRLAGWGAAGVGQSSWGPAVYGVVDGDEACLRLAEHVRAALGTAGTLYHGPFKTSGARVWRAPVD